MNALTAAKPRCRCDSVGVDMCPAGCGAQRDRMARAELHQRAQKSPPDNQTNDQPNEGEQLTMPITAAKDPKLCLAYQTCQKCQSILKGRSVDERKALVASSHVEDWIEAEAAALAPYFMETA